MIVVSDEHDALAVHRISHGSPARHLNVCSLQISSRPQLCVFYVCCGDVCVCGLGYDGLEMRWMEMEREELINDNVHFVPGGADVGQVQLPPVHVTNWECVDWRNEIERRIERKVDMIGSAFCERGFSWFGLLLIIRIIAINLSYE